MKEKGPPRRGHRHVRQLEKDDSKFGDTKRRTVGESNVRGWSPALTKKRQIADEMEDKLRNKKGEVGGVCIVEKLEEEDTSKTCAHQHGWFSEIKKSSAKGSVRQGLTRQVKSNGTVSVQSMKNSERSAIRIGGDAKFKFFHEGKRCCKHFSNAHVKRPLASVRAIVDEGNKIF